MKIHIGTRNFEADGKVRDYVNGKVGALEKYLPRAARGVADVQVLLEEDESGREDNRFVAEIIMTVPGTKLVSREGTVNMYAAVDIVEAKLKAQIRTYKEKQVAKPRQSKFLARLLGRETAESGTVVEAGQPEQTVLN
jgi:putative sigma-54 modulation protein